jgi:hypothetical protein
MPDTYHKVSTIEFLSYLPNLKRLQRDKFLAILIENFGKWVETKDIIDQVWKGCKVPTTAFNSLAYYACSWRKQGFNIQNNIHNGKYMLLKNGERVNYLGLDVPTRSRKEIVKASHIRQDAARRLRMEGLFYSDIAKQLGYSGKDSACDAVKRANARMEKVL